MAEITLTKTAGPDDIGSSRIVFNNNFELIENTINSLLSSLDIDSLILSNIKSITISTSPGTNVGTEASITTLETNGSIKVDGNITCGGILSAQSINLRLGTGLDVYKGSIQLLDATGTLKSLGDLEVAGDVTYTSYSTVLNAYSQYSFITGNVNLLTDLANPEGPTGLVSLVGKKGLILDFTGYTGSSTTNVKKVKLLTDGITIGQEATLIILINESAVPTYWIEILEDTLSFPDSTLYSAIRFTKNYSIITLVYGGATSGWIVTGVSSTGVTYEV